MPETLTRPTPEQENPDQDFNKIVLGELASQGNGITPPESPHSPIKEINSTATLEPGDSPDTIPPEELTAQLEEQRARHNQRILNTLGEIREQTTTKTPEQLHTENETSWMIKEAGEQKSPDQIEKEIDSSWTEYNEEKQKEELEAEKTAREEDEKEIEGLFKESMTDELTGLPNREGFLFDTKNMFENNRDGLYLGFIDINDFKTLNDTLGHRVGDEALQEIGQKLKEQITDKELGVAARFHGDEFAIALNNVNNKEEVEKIVENLKKEMQTIVKKSEDNDPEKTWKANISVGIISGSEIEDVEHHGLGQADSLMYDDKKKTKESEARANLKLIHGGGNEDHEDSPPLAA